jgi:hypothetical protein
VCCAAWNKNNFNFSKSGTALALKDKKTHLIVFPSHQSQTSPFPHCLALPFSALGKPPKNKLNTM